MSQPPQQSRRPANPPGLRPAAPVDAGSSHPEPASDLATAPDTAEPGTAKPARKSWRSAAAVNAALIAALAAATAVGMYSHERLVLSGAAESATAAPAGAAAGFKGSEGATAAAGSSSSAAASTLAVAPFTTADVGDCVTWEGTGTDISNFGPVSCALPHKFEISAREDLGTYPASEFGPEGAAPDITRQAQLREELCKVPTVKYLRGRFDPAGRYSIASILPSAEAWARGDRTMLCGVQVTADNGEPLVTEGSALNQDQSRSAAPGQCVNIDTAQETHVVDCAAPHQYEVTLAVDLKTIFPEGTPAVEAQDEALKPICTQAAHDFVGGEENFYQSTLQVFWTTIPENSWAGGSHTANCAVVHGTPEGTFATLTGSARDAATGGLLIDGVVPPPQPPRNPLRQGN